MFSPRDLFVWGSVSKIVDDYEEEDEEMGGDYGEYELNNFESDEKSEELACPFCSEDFDVLGLCCHIDADHRIEVNNFDRVLVLLGILV